METLVSIIARLDIFLYALIGVGLFFALREFLRARRMRRITIYALEREAEIERQRRATTSIIVLLLLASVVYIISNIVEPNLRVEEVAQPEPTPVVFVPEQPTATPALLLYPTITPTIALAPVNATPAAGEDAGPINGCEIIGSTITSPTAGAVVSGQVRVEGQANILNFAQYKFEVSGAGTGGAWVVVGTYTQPVIEGVLGSWDTTSLAPGSYILRLVTIRTDGTSLTPCEVPITIGGAAPIPTPEG